MKTEKPQSKPQPKHLQSENIAKCLNYYPVSPKKNQKAKNIKKETSTANKKNIRPTNSLGPGLIPNQ